MADEIIEELWRVKEEMAREHGYDIEAFCAYLQRKDREAGFRIVDPQKLKEMIEAGEVRQKRKNEFTAIMERDEDWFVAAMGAVFAKFLGVAVVGGIGQGAGGEADEGRERSYWHLAGRNRRWI